MCNSSSQFILNNAQAQVIQRLNDFWNTLYDQNISMERSEQIKNRSTCQFVFVFQL